MSAPGKRPGPAAWLAARMVSSVSETGSDRCPVRRGIRTCRSTSQPISQNAPARAITSPKTRIPLATLVA